jgi:signal transduction histidine kinase
MSVSIARELHDDTSQSLAACFRRQEWMASTVQLSFKG